MPHGLIQENPLLDVGNEAQLFAMAMISHVTTHHSIAIMEHQMNHDLAPMVANSARNRLPNSHEPP